MQKPIECALECPLGKSYQRGDELVEVGTSFSLPEGKPKFGVALFGEALDKHEAQEGLPFRPNGESGSLITKIIEDLTINDPELSKARKMQRRDFIWDNVIKCRPPNDELTGRSYEKDAVRCCSSYNNRSIDRDDVKVIVALGGVAFKFLTGIEGKKRGIEDVRGYVFRRGKQLVLPALHPSFIRHGNARYTGSLIHDVKKALVVANGRYNSFSEHGNFQYPEIVKKGKLEALVSFFYKMKANAGLTCYVDIENPYSKKADKEEEDKGEGEEDEELEDSKQERSSEITSIQFASSKDWAITIPWEKPFIGVAKAILKLENEKVGANFWHHDQPRLEVNECKINGKVHDVMWAWHHLQPGLWKRLQRIGSFFDCPLIWKHFALDEGLEDEYGCWDVLSLAYIWEKLPQRMRQMGVWDSYLKFKIDLRKLVLRPAEQRGLFVDSEEHTNFRLWTEQESENEDKKLQEETPRELRTIKPSRKDKKTGEVIYGYAREPKQVTELRAGYEQTYNSLRARGVPVKNILSFEKWAERRTGLTCREFAGVVRQDIEQLSLDDEIERVRRWCRVEPFKASSKQLIKYLKFKGYDVPKTLKTNRETTGKKELQELWEKTNDELLGNVIRLRSYNKMLTNDIPNWLPDRDGVVRTTFLFDPPSWQLNSRSPNIQNASKHAKEWELIGKTASDLTLIGQRFRRIVKAPKGRCVVEFDKSGFHVHTMAFEARDPLYLKWANHLHTVVTSYIVGEPISLEGEIDREKLTYIKKKFKIVRDSQAKPAGLGNQLGLGKRKLYYQNKSFIGDDGVRRVGIESEKKAAWLQDLLKDLFPKVWKAKRKFQEEAHAKTYLISEYGAIRWLFDVLRWDYKSRSLKNGSEAEMAIGHKVQSPAFGMMFNELLDMANTSDLLEEHHFANTIHDSFIFFPEIGKRDRCIEEVVRYMRKPEKVLSDPVMCPEGLVVDVEVMASPEEGNWANWHQERNPMGIREVKI